VSKSKAGKQSKKTRRSPPRRSPRHRPARIWTHRLAPSILAPTRRAASRRTRPRKPGSSSRAPWRSSARAPRRSRCSSKTRLTSQGFARNSARRPSRCNLEPPHLRERAPRADGQHRDLHLPLGAGHPAAHPHAGGRRGHDRPDGEPEGRRRQGREAEAEAHEVPGARPAIAARDHGVRRPRGRPGERPGRGVPAPRRQVRHGQGLPRARGRAHLRSSSARAVSRRS
jgi:hypothetical protein